MNAPTGIIDIRGKQYQTVALRVQLFREAHPGFSLTTDVVERAEDCVVMRASIADDNGRVLATGHAEEYRKTSQINRTSALENAETSAIGRALAALGFGGTEFATANEVQNAIHQQNAPSAGRKGAVDEAGEARSAAAPDFTGSDGEDKPPVWKEPGSIYSGIHKLKQGLRQHDRDLDGCGDSDMVYALTSTAEWQEFVKICERHAPHYLHGGEPAPPEFEGLLKKAERLVREFDSAIAENMIDLART